jgi:hypothetical protein
LPNGNLIQKQAFKQSSLKQHDDIKTKATAQSLSQTQKNNLPKIGSDVTTLFVGGAAPSLNGILTGEGEIPVKNYFDRGGYEDNGIAKYTTHKSYSTGEGLSVFHDISNGKRTILIGHSWGADEILDYGDVRPVDLAITIDPVGFIASWGYKINTHINVTADPGPKWAMSWQRFKICKCCCWGCCNIYGWYPKINNWDFSDWIAFSGLKYSNYFSMGNEVADDGLIYKGHHEEFENMLNMVKDRYPSIGLK